LSLEALEEAEAAAVVVVVVNPLSSHSCSRPEATIETLVSDAVAALGAIESEAGVVDAVRAALSEDEAQPSTSAART
jgi:hypothetical protein